MPAPAPPPLDLVRERSSAQEVEICCVCLDSLSSAPVAALLTARSGWALGGAESSVMRRSCAHFIHSECAAMLAPAKCPLCRTAFTALSEPVDQSTLSDSSAPEVMDALRLLAASSSSEVLPTTVPTRTVVELLAATLPMPEEQIRVQLARFAAEETPGEVTLEGLARLLGGLGLAVQRGHGQPRQPLPEAYTAAVVIGRRLQWMALKAAGAAGAGLLIGMCGLGVGVLLGGLSAVPPNTLPDFHGDDDSVILFIKGLWMLILIIHYGAQRADLVCRGLKWGGIAGAVIGWFTGLARVNPDNHGFFSVFWAGFTGSSFTRSGSPAPSSRVKLFGRHHR